MTVSVEFIYDFGSPNTYLAHCVIPEIEKRTGVKIDYVPCLLGGIFKATGNQSPFLAFSKIKGKLEYDRLEISRFIEKHKLTNFRLNKHFPVNTLLLMRGAVAADFDGNQGDYIKVGMRAMWEESLKMDDPKVFADTYNQAGLDGQHLLERSQDDDVKQRLMDNTSRAVERGAFGAPTFYVDDEMFFGKERLGQVEEEIRKHLRSDQ
ncbi:2-hydroxychromene-2-carboxylate isomerase [Hoeflea poritis]|uniref:2-hydroxychromene-2-carboxylate isomerase n=1 Tax=Hoeflea poritis TaxID=2993659 RepID=A0ABT4VKB9_9HYPH|nr:2-hydroxychromene-2-carboxylate isomerase [Hoeflea poritis]MDA4845163.1 2-hydroxychromene-2-carboxylate isomerase [Hoeflea poritis]